MEKTAGGLALLATVAVAALAANGWIAAQALRGDHADILGMEPFVIHAVQRHALGLPLYLNPEAPPFALLQYTPLHYQASAAAVRWLRVDPRDPTAVARIVRGVAVLFWCLGLALVAGWLLRRGAGGPATLALLAWWTTQSGVWWFLARPDAAATFCLFAALAVQARALRDATISWSWLLLAALAAVGAGYAKQNGWQAGAILIAALLARGNWRAAFGAGMAMLAAHAALHGLAWSAWGPAWPANILGALDNGIGFDRAVAMAYAPFGLQSAAVVALAAACAWRWRGREHGERQFLAVAFALLLLFAATAALKIGSAENYFIDAWGVAALLLGHAAADLRRQSADAVRTAGLAGAMFLLLFAAPKLNEARRRVQADPGFAEFRPVAARVNQLLASMPGAWAFCDDARVACLLPDRTCLPQLLLAQIGQSHGRFRYGELAALTASGDLALLVLIGGDGARDVSGTTLLGAPLAGYEFLAAAGPARIFRHRRWR